MQQHGRGGGGEVAWVKRRWEAAVQEEGIEGDMMVGEKGSGGCMKGIIPAHVIHIDLGMKPEATLEGTSRIVMLDSVGIERPGFPIVHRDDQLCVYFAMGRQKKLLHAVWVFQLQHCLDKPPEFQGAVHRRGRR
jgi:hypothetical protein